MSRVGGSTARTPTRVLLVEDDANDVLLLRALLDEGGGSDLELEAVDTLEAARARMEGHRFRAILLDLHLPGRRGLDSLREMIAIAPNLPIIVLTGLHDEDLGIRAVQEGAQDYLPKDQLSKVLLLRSVRHAIERHQMRTELRELAMTDELTGVYNRRGFFRMGRQLMDFGWRTHTPVALLFADVDELKLINDTHGHAEGDRVLARVGRLLRHTYRQSDVIGRLGGDEFAVLGQVEQGTEAEFAHRLVDALDRQARKDGGTPLRLSVGSAVATIDQPLTLEELLRLADGDMFRDKREKDQTAREGASHEGG